MNVNGTAHCRACQNDAMIMVGVQEPSYGEEYGPCPFCERGERVEFSGRWGPEGYWRGRLDMIDAVRPSTRWIPPVTAHEKAQVLSYLKASGWTQ